MEKFLKKEQVSAIHKEIEIEKSARLERAEKVSKENEIKEQERLELAKKVISEWKKKGYNAVIKDADFHSTFIPISLKAEYLNPKKIDKVFEIIDKALGIGMVGIQPWDEGYQGDEEPEDTAGRDVETYLLDENDEEFIEMLADAFQFNEGKYKRMSVGELTKEISDKELVTDIKRKKQIAKYLQ